MARRGKKADAALISLLILIGLPIMGVVALYEAMGPVLFFGSLVAILVGYVVYKIYRAKEQQSRAAGSMTLDAVASHPDRLELVHEQRPDDFVHPSAPNSNPKTSQVQTHSVPFDSSNEREATMEGNMLNAASKARIPWFGVRRFARSLLTTLESCQHEVDALRRELKECGGLTLFELDARRKALEAEIARQTERIAADQAKAAAAQSYEMAKLADLKKLVVATEDLALLQEAGIYQYKHPLSDAVAYQAALDKIQTEIKDRNRKDGGAILASTNWSVNGSASQGAAMTRDFSKLMLRAFNAEADNLARGLKPYKLDGAIERLRKVAATIQKLGQRMGIHITDAYLNLRIQELELTADFLQKQAEEKEAPRQEREQLREERKVQLEMERER